MTTHTMHVSQVSFRPNSQLRMTCKIAGVVLAAISIFLTARLFYQLSDISVEKWTLAIIGVAVEFLKIAMAGIGAGLLLRKQWVGVFPLSLSILIMITSFSASMGFMSSSTTVSQHKAVESSAQYNELSNLIHLKMNQINDNSAVIAKNSVSRHASKRGIADKAAAHNERLAQEIDQLKQDREQLKGKTITTSSSAFDSIGRLIGASGEQAKAVLFSVLAVLLEILSVMCFAYSSDKESVEAKKKRNDSYVRVDDSDIDNELSYDNNDLPEPPRPTPPNGGGKKTIKDRMAEKLDTVRNDFNASKHQSAREEPSFAQSAQAERNDFNASVPADKPYNFQPIKAVFDAQTTERNEIVAKNQSAQDVEQSAMPEQASNTRARKFVARDAIQLDTGRGEQDGHRYRAVKAAVENGEIKPTQRAIKDHLKPCSFEVAANYQRWLMEEEIIEKSGNSYKLKTDSTSNNVVTLFGA